MISTALLHSVAENGNSEELQWISVKRTHLVQPPFVLKRVNGLLQTSASYENNLRQHVDRAKKNLASLTKTSGKCVGI